MFEVLLIIAIDVCGNDASVIEFDEHMNRVFKKFEAFPESLMKIEYEHIFTQ